MRKNPIRTAGIGQGGVRELILPITQQSRITIDILKVRDGVDVYIYDVGIGVREYNRVYEKVFKTLSNYVYGSGEETLRDSVCRMLIKSGKKIALAESLTGGRISDRLTDTAGSSNFFILSVVVYADESKTRLLGVPEEVMKQWGAVSRQTCRKMLEGLSDLGDFHFRIAVTGTAGPSGGTPTKPVGTVYVGVQDSESVHIKKFRFLGTRYQIKEDTSSAVMQLLWKKLNRLP